MPYRDRLKQRLYQVQWLDRRRREWLSENGPCVRCASWEDLQPHHKDPKQKLEHRIWSWTKERRDAELAKCEVLCEKCHIKYHADDRRKPITHGTHTGYSHYDYRCYLCKEAQMEYTQRRRAELVRWGLPSVTPGEVSSVGFKGAL